MKPARLALYFYRGGGNWFDKLTKWRTSGEFTHVELFMNGDAVPDADGISFSASQWDGGTRFKKLEYTNLQDWEQVVLPTHRDEMMAQAIVREVYNWCLTQDHKGYDWKGILQLVSYGKIKTDDTESWYCSEICAHALWQVKVLPTSVGLTPDLLYHAVESFCRGYGIGWQQCSALLTGELAGEIGDDYNVPF